MKLFEFTVCNNKKINLHLIISGEYEYIPYQNYEEQFQVGWNNILIKHIHEDGTQNDFHVSGRDMCGNEINEYDAVADIFQRCLLYSKADDFELLYIEDGLKNIIEQSRLGVAFEYKDRPILLRFNDVYGDLYDLCIATDKFTFYFGALSEVWNVFDTETGEQLFKYDFAEILFNNSVDAIKIGEEKLMYDNNMLAAYNS